MIFINIDDQKIHIFSKEKRVRNFIETLKVEQNNVQNNLMDSELRELTRYENVISTIPTNNILVGKFEFLIFSVVKENSEEIVIDCSFCKDETFLDFALYLAEKLSMNIEFI